MALRRKRKRDIKRRLLLLFITLLFLWGAVVVSLSLVQVKLAVYLLYDVARFEAEMVTHQLNGGAQSSTTEDLNGLLQALYAFRYAHSNLSEATQGKVPLLSSDSLLIDTIFRWQLGGDRALTEGEKTLLTSVHEDYKAFYEHYRVLMKGEVVQSEAASLLEEADLIIRDKIRGWER